MTTSRRTVLKYSAGLAALGLAPRPALAEVTGPIRIGVIYDLSGPFAAAGSMACMVGAQIAIDLTNERGGVMGKNRQYVFRTNVHSDQYGAASAGFVAENAKAKLGMDPKDVKVAIIHEDGPYGVGCGEAGAETAKKLGMEVVLKEAYSASAPD